MEEALALAGAAQLRRVVGRVRCLAAANAELEASGPRCSVEELPAKHDRADVVAGPHLAEELGIPLYGYRPRSIPAP
ncbi:MAG: hypothetical protein ACRD0C_10820 [Acidimicrobiia bacterium]